MKNLLLILIVTCLLSFSVYSSPTATNPDGARVEKLSCELWGGSAEVVNGDGARVRLSGDFYSGAEHGNPDRTLVQMGQFDCWTILVGASIWMAF